MVDQSPDEPAAKPRTFEDSLLSAAPWGMTALFMNLCPRFAQDLTQYGWPIAFLASSSRSYRVDNQFSGAALALDLLCIPVLGALGAIWTRMGMHRQFSLGMALSMMVLIGMVFGILKLGAKYEARPQPDRAAPSYSFPGP